MIVKIEYKDQNDRIEALETNKDMYLVEEQNITEGNFLIFTDVKPIEREILDLQQENILLKAQNQALTDRTDFHEEVLTEIIVAINS